MGWVRRRSPTKPKFVSTYSLLVLYILNVRAAPQYPVSRCKIIIKRMVSKPGGLNVIEVIPPQSVA